MNDPAPSAEQAITSGPLAGFKLRLFEAIRHLDDQESCQLATC